MKRLLVGTSNPGKLQELGALLEGDYEVLGLEDVEGTPPEVEEDGRSYRENALKKARAYQAWSGMPVLADDSGLEVDALLGAPGVDSAEWGGADLTWPERWAFLLNQLKPFPQPWSARFRCLLCFVEGDKAPVFFEGIAPGRVLPEPTGTGGFGYDPIVYSDELKLSFAQAQPADKNRVSHRARALAAFRAWISLPRP